MNDLTLSCQCKTILGVVRSVTPQTGNRLICYCNDCRAFANHLQPDSRVLNSFGGTEIYQVAPSTMEILSGLEQLACLRLSDKGLYRWYAKCCDTPIGNTVGIKLPFVGLIHTFISRDQDIDSKLGSVLGSVYPEQALAENLQEVRGGKSRSAIMFRVVTKLVAWKVCGKSKPNPFFAVSGKPVVEPIIMSNEREND